MTKKNVIRLLKFTFIFWMPIVLYVVVYCISLVIALSYGARPTVLSLLTHSYADPFLESTGKGLTPFFIVASKEIEDCDKNPREVYPNGYVEDKELVLGTKNQINSNVGKGRLFAYDIHWIFSLGFPVRNVMQAGNCPDDSQKLTKDDFIGTWTLIKYDFFENSWTSKYSDVFTQNDLTLTFKDDDVFYLHLGCYTVAGKYTILSNSLVFNQIQTLEQCNLDQVDPSLATTIKLFQSELKVFIYPNILLFSSPNSDTYSRVTFIK